MRVWGPSNIKARVLLMHHHRPQARTEALYRACISCSAFLLFVISRSASAQGVHLQKGLELIRQGQYAAALPEFEQAERDHPGNASIENALGIIETKLGDLQIANRHYQKAILLSPKLEEAHKNLGFNYLTEKQYSLAEGQLRIATSLDPGDPFAHYYLALLYLTTGRDLRAVKQLAPSQPVLLNDPQASFEMAEACLRLNQIKAALPLVDALEQSALSLPQQYSLAVLLSVKQQYPQSVELFRRMVKADPNSWRNQYNLAIGLLRMKQPAEAVSMLEPLVAERPQDADVLSLLGIAYEADGKSAKALHAYREAMRADPTNPNHYLEYTRLLMDAGRLDQSEKLIETGLKLVPDAYALEMRLGAVHMMLDQYSDARQDLQKAIESHPEIPLGYVALAQSYLRQQQNQQAADVLAAARQKLPNHFILQYFYGEALLRLGRDSNAVQILKEAVALRPDAPDAHFLLGRAYLQANQSDAARTEFERTTQLAPQDANAYYELARIYSKQGETEKARQMAERMTQLKQKQYEAALRAQSALLNSTR
jgi:predicted Zn-dependent protease